VSIPFLERAKSDRFRDDAVAFTSIEVTESTIAVHERAKRDRNRREIDPVIRKTVHDRSICVHSFSVMDRNRRVDVLDRRFPARIRAKNSLNRVVTQEEGGRHVMTTSIKAVKRSIVSPGRWVARKRAATHPFVKSARPELETVASSPHRPGRQDARAYVQCLERQLDIRSSAL
jgi:hypothetical protein